ncbi:helix-turn-helix domain-containing protein [Chloroflexota bacterium]
MANIGDVLRRLRAERDWTQKQLSQASGLSQTDIARIENGVTKRPSAKTVGRLSRALGIEIEELEMYSREGGQPEAVAAAKPSPEIPAVIIDAVEVPVMADMHAPGEPIEYAYLPKQKAAGKNIFGVKIRGTSLEQYGVKDGEVLFIDKDLPPEVGRYLLCYDNSDEHPRIVRYSAPSDIEGCVNYGVIVSSSKEW